MTSNCAKSLMKSKEFSLSSYLLKRIDALSVLKFVIKGILSETLVAESSFIMSTANITWSGNPDNNCEISLKDFLSRSI